jgi:PAS domain S-box-containing protein
MADTSNEPGHTGAPMPDPAGEWLLALLDALPTPASIASESDRVIIYANDPWLRLLGFSTFDEVKGRSIESLIAPEYLDKARRALARGSETGEYSRADRRYRLVRADGTLADVIIAGAPAMLGGSRVVVSLVTDAGEDEDTLQALQAADLRYQTLVDNSADGIFVYDDDMTLVFANPAGLRLFGAARAEEAVGRRVWDFIAPESRDLVAARVHDAHGTGGVQPPQREMLLDIDGRAFPAEVNSMPITYEGEPAILATVRDLTNRETAQKAVSDSETFLRRVLDTTSDLVYIYDLVENRNVYANREIVDYLGYTPEQIRDFGSTLFDRILDPDDALAVSAHHAAMATAKDGETRDVEYRMRNSDGQWRWLHSRDVPFSRDETGRVTQILGSAQDTTDRKLAVDALAVETQRLKAHLDNSPLATIEFDPQRRVTRWSEAAERLFGWTSDEIMGRSVIGDFPWVYEDDIQAVSRVADELSSGRALTSVSENRNYRKDGSVINCIWYNSALLDSTGHVESLMSRVLDVTDRVRAEEELRDSEERYRSVVAVLRDGIILQAADGRLLTFNDAAAEIFHIEPGAAVGQTSVSRDWGTIRLDGTDLPGDEHPSMLTFRTGEPCTDMLVGVKGPEGVRWIEVNTEPMIRPGETLPYAVVVSCADVTERRRVAEELESYRTDLERVVEERTRELTETNRALEEASRAKSQFLASMSHELRTPLNSIIGFTGIMLQGLTGELTSEQRAQLGMVNRAGRQLLGLVSDVLDLERIESGRIELELEDVDVRKLATGLADTVRPMAEDVGLTLDLDLDRAPAFVHTDRSKLEQILLNFLSNSVKYTETGSIALIVEKRGDGSAAFAVRDTGIGIAAEDQERIFEEFRQLPAHRGAKHPGSGLGLAISVQLAEVIGGHIELESTLAVGSTFTLVLPSS